MEASEEAIVLSCGDTSTQREDTTCHLVIEQMSLKSRLESSMRAEPPSSPGANWLCGKRAEPSGPPSSGALHPRSMTLLKSTGPLHPGTPNPAMGNLLPPPQLKTFCLGREWWNPAVSHLTLLFVQRRAMQRGGTLRISPKGSHRNVVQAST